MKYYLIILILLLTKPAFGLDSFQSTLTDFFVLLMMFVLVSLEILTATSTTRPNEIGNISADTK